MATALPVTVKHRIGLGRSDDYGFVRDFVGTVGEAGCEVFIVHARNAAKAADLFGPHVEVVTDLERVAAQTRVDAIINNAQTFRANAPMAEVSADDVADLGVGSTVRLSPWQQ